MYVMESTSSDLIDTITIHYVTKKAASITSVQLHWL